MPRFAKPGAFSREVRRRGIARVNETPNGRFANDSQLLLTAVLGAALIVIYVIGVTGGWGLPLWSLALSFGLCAYLFSATAAHDAAHGALTRSRAINRSVTFVSFMLFGVSGSLWAWRHNRIHHMFPNVVGTEIDHECTEILRLSPNSRWRFWHRLQPVYAPICYAFLFTSVALFEDIKYFTDARREAPDRFATLKAYIDFWATKLLHIALVAVVPAVMLELSIAEVLATYCLAVCIPSFIFSALVVGTHIAGEAEFHIPDHQDQLPHDWATHQMLTSVDWSPRNRLAILLTGGVNTHTAHHLFPEVANCHARELDQIVAEAVQKHDVPRHLMSFSEMILSHFRLLVDLSKPHGGLRVET